MNYGTHRIRLVLSVIALVLFCSFSVYAGVADNFMTWTLSEYERETGNIIDSFNEAPELATLVEAGELPPVNERLPIEPLVVQPTGEIGTYGGSLKGYGMNPESYGNNVTSIRNQQVLGTHPTWATFYPQVIKEWTLSDDHKTFVMHLRKGMKWSDGTPFTADDIVFWWQDVILNKELTASVSSVWVVNGEPMQVNKIDDYTVELKFAGPYTTIIETLAAQTVWVPAHYAKQWHAEYNPQVHQLAKDAGYDYWYQLYSSRTRMGDAQTIPGIPTLEAWVLESIDQFGNKYYKRNPYYWKIDTAGNQLPYIGELIRFYVPDRNQIILKFISGELDFGSEPLQISDLTVLRQGEARGGYETILMPSTFGSQRRYQFNQTTQDSVLREIFSDIRFRQAMSLAINRNEINQTLFFGLGVPRQHLTPSVTSFYEAWMGEHYAEFDLDAANALLDEMGLEWDRARQYRLRPDGQVLEVELLEPTGGELELTEMVAGYWQEVGVKVNLRQVTRELFSQRAAANELQANAWFGDAIDEVRMRTQPQGSIQPPYALDTIPMVGWPWREWQLTNGQRGEEPPVEIREIQDLVSRWLKTVKGTDEYMELGQEILSRNVQGLYMIGTVGELPRPFVLRNGLRNFPKDMTWVDHLRGSQADQWFWEQ